MFVNQGTVLCEKRKTRLSKKGPGKSTLRQINKHWERVSAKRQMDGKGSPWMEIKEKKRGEEREKHRVEEVGGWIKAGEQDYWMGMM